MSGSLEGKTCIVTGATSGLGRACAEQLAGRGARVELVCRNPHKAEQARAEIASATGNSEVGVVIAGSSGAPMVALYVVIEPTCRCFRSRNFPSQSCAMTCTHRLVALRRR